MIPLGILAQGGQIYTTWTKTSAPATRPYHSITHAALAAGNWFMFGAGSSNATTNSYYYSTNGTSWTTGTMPATRLWGLSATNGTTLVAYEYSSGSTSIYTTTNGTTWTARSLGASYSDFNVLKYLDGRFWVGGSSSTTGKYSSDGTTWTSVSNSSFADLDFGSGVYIGLRPGGTDRICTGDPTNSANWVSLTLPTVTSTDPMTVAFNNGVWVVGYGGSSVSTATYAYSTDNGANWSTGTLPAALGQYRDSGGATQSSKPNTRIRAVDGAFYYSIDNSVYYSTDGVSWSTVSTGSGFTFNSKGLASNGSGEAIMVGVGGTNATNVSQYLKGE